MRVIGPVWSLAAVLLASPLAAQPVDTPPSGPVVPADNEQPPAYVAGLEGVATLTRAGETLPLELHALVIDGDRLRVDAGYLELRWDDGAVLFVDERTTLDVATADRLRLADGRVRFVAGRRTGSPRWTLDTPAAAVDLTNALDALIVVAGSSASQPVDVFALLGTVDLANDRGHQAVAQGSSAHAEVFRAPVAGRGSPPSGGLMAWSQARLDEDARSLDRAPVSTGTVEYDDYAYDSTLVRYGTWDRDPEYGAVWYPSVTVADWRPYHYGRWDRVGRYGYVWIGSDPWSYRTHHYGRWGHRGGRWFWIPGRTWASAWVSWAVGPGYVSWSPLGYDNRPVFSFGLSIGSSYRRGFGDRYDGWSGWTVVPADRWRSRGRVDRYAVNPRQLPDSVRGAFVTQNVAPFRRGTLSRLGGDSYAVPRGSSRGDTREGLQRGIGPTRVERDGARAYVPVTPRRPQEPASAPYERARRYMDRGSVPQGAPVPQGERPDGAYRRRSTVDPPVRTPADPPVERPSADDRVAPRSRNYNTIIPRGDDRRDAAGGRRAPQYTRPEAPPPSNSGGAQPRVRPGGDSSRPSGSRIQSRDAGPRPSGSSGDRQRPNRVPPDRRPRG